MWFVDAIAEYIEMGVDYFAPALEDMINDSFLGFSVIAFAMIIWVVYILIKDPKGVVRKALQLIRIYDKLTMMTHSGLFYCRRLDDIKNLKV